MSKFLQRILVCLTVILLPWSLMADDYQLPDPGFEDWTGSTFEGEPQLKYWHASNVSQSALGMSFNFNFSHRESGHTGNYSLMVQDQTVGAAGITETSPGYASLGYGWQYLEGLNTGSATAGTKGGISFTHRPDTVAIWIKRTGNNTDKEDFHILFYSWAGTAQGTSYKNKNTNCTSTTVQDEESDIRLSLDWNQCKTTTPGDQVAEGWLRDRKNYGSWTRVLVPIYYLTDKTPKKCNLILSASNYPNFRANDGLYEGNSLYVDDVELIYSSKIQTLRVGGTQWKGFDPNSTEEQVYFLPEGTTTIPEIEARRGAGTLSNVPNQSTSKTVEFQGRKLSGDEIEIVKGKVGEVTTITVYAENNRNNKTVYKIRFQAAASSNAKLANIMYYYKDINGKQQHVSVSNFNQSTYNYNVELPYGTQEIDSVTYEKQEDEQTVSVKQPESKTGTAELTVTAADGKSKATYKVKFAVGQLADNTLKDIQVNGTSIPGFTPTQTVYKVSLPVGTPTLTINPVSAYNVGEQTIVVTPNPLPTGDAIDGTTVQISVTTPGNTVAKVYKLNIKLEASSYSYLASLQLQGDQVMRCNPCLPDDTTQLNFTPENMTYYVLLKMGTTSLPKILYSRGDKDQTIDSVGLNGAVDGTFRITVTAGNKSDQSVYKIVFSTLKSDRSTLKGIKIDGVDLEGFHPDVFSYSYVLPVGTTELPEIEAVEGDEYQKIDITPGGVNGKTRITVTAGDGSTSIYQIAFSVATYSVNTLQGIYLDGELIEGFEAEKNEYWVNLEQGTTKLPEVTWLEDNKDFQKVTVRELPEGTLNGDYKLTVRPLNGASRTYIIHFSVATSSNVTLTMIYLDGKPLEYFDPETLHYVDSLEMGVSTIPTVTFDKAEETQRVLSVLNGKIQTITVTAESGAKREYTIEFVVRASDNAKLDMIYLDGEKLPKFSKEEFSYTWTLKGDKCPVITVDKAPGQQVTITAPYAEGIATIAVKAETGDASTYTIKFVAAPLASIQLEELFINGEKIADFHSDSLDYTATYSKEQPTITYTKKDASQTVTIVWKENVAWIHVTDSEGNKGAYSITFTRIYSGNNKLEAIYADGDSIEGFDSDKLNYTYELEPGTAYPTISYKVAEAAQVVFFGQVAEGKWAIQVTAENKDVVEYTVAYTIKKYSDPKLVDLQVEGYPFTFDPAETEYGPFQIQEGLFLPQVVATPKEGQSVIIYNTNDSTQQVLVMAENGAEKMYTIKYSRIKSSLIQLENIYVDSKPLVGFDPEVANYTVTLPRDTKVVPNVNPIALLDNQTVTTYFGRPNEKTTIEVKSQDGHTGYYTIDFQVEKSDDTLLESLKINGEKKDTTETDYTFNVPFGTTQPYDIAYALKDGQSVHFVEAPITGTTKIIVTNEKGNNSRTYSISYNIAQPEGENIIKNVKYSYVTASDATVDGEIVPKKGANTIDLPFGAKSFEVTEVEKNFNEQTIYFYNGGIRRGATIIATANRTGEDDIVYTIVPNILPDTVGKLKSLTFKGTSVPRFRRDVYNYMVNVTAQPTAADFEGVAYNGAKVTKSSLDAKKKQIKLTVEGGEEYSICWYYPEDEAPFTFNWVDTKIGHWYEVSTLGGIFGSQAKDKGLASNSTGYKPEGWSVPADLFAYIDYDATVSHFTYYTGKEVNRISDKEVLLSTIRGGALNSSVPGVMTLGEVQLSNGVALNGNTTFKYVKDLSKYKTYRNTPEQFAFDYQPLMTINGINTWTAWVSIGTDNNTKVAYDMSGDYSNLGQWRTKTQNLTYNFTVQRMNVMICASESSGQNLEIYAGGTAKSSDLQIRNIRFVYNSVLTAATVNGKATVRSGNTFTYTLGADEVILGEPALKFTCQKPDQTQTIEWLNNGEWVNGELKAKVVNYGENANVEGRDSTVYTVVLHREAVTSLNYTASFGSYPTQQKGDTVFVNLPSGTKKLPNMTITPTNVHQLFTMTKKGNAVTVNVAAENGTDSTTVYVFREVKSNEVDPNYIDFPAGCTVVGDPEDFNFTLEAEKMPAIDFAKKEGQTVDVTYTANSFVLKITAEDGVTTRTYTINRIDPTTPTTGQIREFKLGGAEWEKLGGTTYTAEGNKPTELVTFERKDNRDSVVYIQAPDKMEWQVYGSENHTYTLTYPTSKSSNAILADLLVGGQSYSEFSTLDFEYTIESDTAIILEAVASELTQTIATEQTPTEGEIVVYTTTVTAEDGVSKKQYSVTVRRPKSTDATLAGIMLDDEPLPGFDPSKFAYTVELPLPADGVKRAEPQMPNITYAVGQEGQKVVVTAGALNGSATEFEVTSEAGNSETYYLTINSEKSHCVDLTGITVNGESVDQFEKGRHYYSLSLKTSQFTVDYTTDDAFQKVTPKNVTITENHQYNYILEVEAEDGVTTEQYEVMIYVENQSNDAHLANILLEGKDFQDFERDLNPDLVFDPANKDYTIQLPSGTTVLPEVSAQLKMDGQNVEIKQGADSTIRLDVTAVDGSTHIEYALKFEVPLSKNADLSMIFLDGKPLENFNPTYYFYQVTLDEGIHTAPEVAAQKGEASQTLDEVVWNKDRSQATIKVHAEAGDAEVRPSTYVVVFTFTKSDADTLNMIYQDGQDLPGFRPDSMYYAISLPVGTLAFPDISWEEVNDLQTIEMDTVEFSADSTTLIRQIKVTAESGKKNTYTVSYTIEKSSIATLQMVFVDQKQLPYFQPNTFEYNYELSAAEALVLNGSLPTVEFIQGDEYQKVLVSQAPDTLSYKTLGYKSLITVTAASGKMNLYTIHYPVELSTDATLNMINVGGKPLANFDSERRNYKLEIEMEASIPIVSVIKKEEAQVYDIQVLEDTVQIFVTAENTEYTNTYTLTFERLKSKVTTLRDIILLDAEGERLPSAEFPFRQDVYSYIVKLEYNKDKPAVEQLPTRDYTKYDEEQKIEEAIHELPNGDIQLDITVTAPNGEDQAVYSIIFKFIKPSDSLLAGLFLKGNEFPDFRPTKTEYVYKHPYGTDPKDYFTAEDVTFELSDTLATVEIFMDEYNMINVVVTAQDEVTTTTYLISQITLEDGDNALAWITVNGEALKDFDPEETFYTYYVYKSDNPTVLAGARSVNALDVDVAPFAPGDTCVITCIAADNSMRKYYIHFAITSIDPGAKAQDGSVMVKRVPGANQLFVASIRSGVDFGLYDRNGKQLFYYTAIPTAEPNNVEVYVDGQNKEVLSNVLNYTDGILVDIVPNEPLFYVFFSEGKKISEGRIMFMQ